MKAGEDLLREFDKAPLGGRYWTVFGLFIITFAFESFDFYVVSFLIPILSPQWHLTYLQSSLILLSAGVGAMVGALCSGTLADRWGRKRFLVVGAFICACAAGTVSLIPDEAWRLFVFLRFFVGFGLAASTTPMIALLVEFTPTRYRTLLTGIPVIAATLGSFLSSTLSATLIAHLGWRGMAALGIAPAIVATFIWILSPESVRWLVVRGRLEEARAIIARLLKKPASEIPLPAAVPTAAPPAPAGLGELYAVPSRFWFTVITWMTASTANYGVYLWGPTIIVLLLGITTGEAARWFVLVGLVGLTGKVVFAFLPSLIGRRATGQLGGYGIAVALGAAAFFHAEIWHGVPMFIVCVAAGALFFDGCFANLTPYTVEIHPVRLSGRGFGLAQASNGLGKVLGPLLLGLIAGANNFVTPRATAEAVVPAFLFLAACGLVGGLCFTLLGQETRGKPLALGIEPMAPERAPSDDPMHDPTPSRS
jgi:MFS transporter, putative metabolite:H+ symporter